MPGRNCSRRSNGKRPRRDRGQDRTLRIHSRNRHRGLSGRRIALFLESFLFCSRASVQWGCTFHLSAVEGTMYHYDPNLALEELQEDALLPHPVKLRDMILRTKLEASQAQLLNHDFQDYLTRFGELQKLGRGILDRLATGQRKAS